MDSCTGWFPRRTSSIAVGGALHSSDGFGARFRQHFWRNRRQFDRAQVSAQWSPQRRWIWNKRPKTIFQLVFQYHFTILPFLEMIAQMEKWRGSWFEMEVLLLLVRMESFLFFTKEFQKLMQNVLKTENIDDAIFAVCKVGWRWCGVNTQTWTYLNAIE